MNNEFSDRAMGQFKSICSRMRLIDLAAIILSLTSVSLSQAQTTEGDASNRAFDLLIKRFAPPSPTFILTPESYATWGKLDLDETILGTSTLQSNEVAIMEDLKNTSVPVVQSKDTQDQHQALVVIKQVAEESAARTESSLSFLTGSGNTDLKQDTQAEIKTINSVEVVTTDILTKPSSGSSLKDALKIPPTPASRPREAYGTAPASSSASDDASTGVEVITGSEAQILYDQLISIETTGVQVLTGTEAQILYDQIISRGTTRGSRRMDGGSISTMPSQ